MKATSYLQDPHGGSYSGKAKVRPVTGLEGLEGE
jgi:hypothetical protein